MEPPDRLRAAVPWAVLATAVLGALAGIAWQRTLGEPIGWGVLSLQTGVGLALALVARTALRLAPTGPPGGPDEFVRRIGRWSDDGGEISAIGLDEDHARCAVAVAAAVRNRAAEGERLRADLEGARRMLEAAPNGLLAVGLDGRIAYANSSMKRLFGLSEDVAGQLPLQVFRLPEIQDAVEEAIRGEHQEHRCTWGQLDLVVGAHPLGDLAMVVVSDVTGLRDVERSRTEFVANVSHELRTPITAIQGYAETLMAEPERLPADIVPLIATIYRNARRLSNIFEDLLRLHRIEVRRRQLPLQLEPLRPLLDGGSAHAAESATAKGIRFRVECPEDAEAFVNAEAFETIISNLTSNAVAYTDEGGEVVVRARFPAGAGPVVEVVDTGIGIDSVLHERVFERFFRVDEGRSRRAGGTGLGLAIVKHLALASHCRVSLESALGKGSCFRVEVPTRAYPDED